MYRCLLVHLAFAHLVSALRFAFSQKRGPPPAITPLASDHVCHHSRHWHVHRAHGSCTQRPRCGCLCRHARCVNWRLGAAYLCRSRMQPILPRHPSRTQWLLYRRRRQRKLTHSNQLSAASIPCNTSSQRVPGRPPRLLFIPLSRSSPSFAKLGHFLLLLRWRRLGPPCSTR
jgi:hypothetical protein